MQAFLEISVERGYGAKTATTDPQWMRGLSYQVRTTRMNGLGSDAGSGDPTDEALGRGGVHVWGDMGAWGVTIFLV